MRMVGTAGDEVRRRQAVGLLLELHGQAQYTLFLGSLIVLALTGLPQKFDSLGPSRWLMDSAGGIESLRLIHHIAGAALIFACIYHLATVLVAVLVFRVRTPLRMIPCAEDVRDALQTIRYFLGLRRESVATGRPSYFQKLDYAVIVWSMAVMGVSGIIALFPVRAARLVSGEAVVASLRAHSDAAILVTAWVLIVHLLYGALTPKLFLDRPAILTGKRERAAATTAEAGPVPQATAPTATVRWPGRAGEVDIRARRRREESRG